MSLSIWCDARWRSRTIESTCANALALIFDQATDFVDFICLFAKIHVLEIWTREFVQTDEPKLKNKFKTHENF